MHQIAAFLSGRTLPRLTGVIDRRAASTNAALRVLDVFAVPKIFLGSVFVRLQAPTSSEDGLFMMSWLTTIVSIKGTRNYVSVLAVAQFLRRKVWEE
jgi:hypothetical protein